jgi:octaprenyl-diphosphate synthase
VLDFSGNASEIGKNVGDDLAEGKPTLPLLYAMRHGNQQQSELIRNAIEHGGIENLQAVVEAVRETGALAHVTALAQQEANAACAAISHLPVSNYHQALVELSTFAVRRTY